MEELEREMEAPDFWNDPERSQRMTKELKNLKQDVGTYRELASLAEDIDTMIELGYEEDDASLLPEIGEMIDDFSKKLDTIRMKTLLSGEFDAENAIVTLHAGAGGTEACDWTSMLYRMYTRWAAAKGYEVEVVDYLDGDEAGIKSVTFQVNGENAYGFLKSEKGVHRLVRMSPFNAQGKRQTSFASCDVMPDLEEDLDVEIREEDLKIDTYRAQGAGGQHVNKTSSAVRVTHIPTGITAQCQKERSQFMNKDKAIQFLKAKLYLRKLAENEERMKAIQGDLSEIAWGNQIRSYFMQPSQLVTALRTNEENGNAEAVMYGDIARFINAHLKWVVLGQKVGEE